MNLSSYEPSKKWLQALEKNFSDDSLKSAEPSLGLYLQKPVLTFENFCAVLKALLCIDDISTMQQYADITQFNVKVGKNKLNKYFIKFDKTAMNNVSLLRSQIDEIVLVSRAGLEDSPLPKPLILARSMRGNRREQILKMTRSRVYFHFEDKLLNEPFDVIFRSPRIPYRLMYCALDVLQHDLNMRRYLFPIPGSVSHKATNKLNTLNLFNSAIASNAEQLQAVQQIVAGPNPQAPYIVFGPPGTGKTTTILEAILQLCLQGHNRILVTAGSNSACDTIALKICNYIESHSRFQTIVGLKKHVMLRLLPYSRIRKAKKTIHPMILNYSNYRLKNSYEGMRKIELPHFKIIVATLCSAGILNILNTPQFTHIFIDEAAASIEPETLLAMVGNMHSPCHVILSGDHKQLGPVVKCDRAAFLGLSQSLMDRLLLNKLYEVDASGNYDKTLQTRLRRNYRSHPEIVGIYNKLYYNGELIPLAPLEQVSQAANWSVLPNGQFPIIFQAAHGSTEREVYSTSSYNKKEAEVLCWYLTNLLRDGLGRGIVVNQEDIGIVSPYLAQCKLLKRMLRQRDITNVKVGSVESYQGGEKSIIIVSMVSSFKSTSFLSNPRRVNVLLSRVKSLMILIGNPITLSENKSFKFIIDLCKTKGNLLYNENNLRDDFTKSQEKIENVESGSDSDSSCSSSSSLVENRMSHLSVFE